MTGTNVGTAYLEVIPSAKGFAGKLQSEVGGDMTKTGRTAGESYSRGFSGGLKKLVGLAAGFVAVEKITGYLGDSVEAASDLNETTNMSSVIFGKNADAIAKWATTSDESFGLSEQAALQAAASLGDMFLQLGIGDERATKLSKSTVQMAADLGSFKNLETGDVLERISGALRGEYDSLQLVIPNINAARVEHEALAKTGKSSAKELTAAEKAAAVLAIVHKDGARAAGDFARTSDGLANSQKIQAAEAENLKAKIGKGLLPIQLAYTKFMADKAIPAISDFVGGMQDGTGAGGDFVDVIEDTVRIGKGILNFFNSIPGPVKKYGAELAIAAVVLSKVNGGLLAGRTAIGNWLTALAPAEGTLTRTQKASYALGVGLRNLAGAGGMLAIVHGAQESNKAVGAMELTLGGAAAGFAAGGPIGAGIGVGVGLFVGLKNAIAGTNDMRLPTPEQLGITDIINGLDEANGKATEFTRNSLFDFLKGKTKGAPPAGLSVGTSIRDTAKLYGIPDKQLVDAMTGDVKQFERIKERLNAAVRDNPNNGITASDQRMLIGNIQQATKAYREQQRQIRENISANGDYGELLAGFPKNLITKIETVGLPVTEAGVVRLTKKMDLTPKQIKTVIEATNVPTTLAKVQSIINKGNEWSRLHPSTTVDANTEPARTKVSALVSDIRNLLAGNFTALVNANVTGPRKRATGGPVSAGQPYIVGERRPELFVPTQSGRIIPRVPASGSGVDAEQASYRAFTRALADTGTVIMPKASLDAFDLVVGAM